MTCEYPDCANKVTHIIRYSNRVEHYCGVHAVAMDRCMEEFEADELTGPEVVNGVAFDHHGEPVPVAPELDALWDDNFNGWKN